MKKKLDLSFIVFVVIIIVGGIYVNYLSASRNRWRETCHYREMEVKKFHEGTDFLLRVLFEAYKKKSLTDDSIIKIDEKPERESVDLRDRMMLYIVGDSLEKLHDQWLGFVLNSCKDVNPSRLVVVVDEKCDPGIIDIVKAYPYRVFKSRALGNRIGRETAFFYVGEQRQVEAYLMLNDYTLGVLSNYVKLIQDHYLK